MPFYFDDKPSVHQPSPSGLIQKSSDLLQRAKWVFYFSVVSSSLGMACLWPFAAFAQQDSFANQIGRLPPVEIDQALKTFQLEHGFELEIVAAEPMVGDPVDACFDEHGRMFVAEFHAYPYALEKDQIIPAGRGRTTTGIVRMLEDLDGDGVMDRSTIFADQLDWPLAVIPYQGGIFLIDVPDVIYLKDTDGDGVADVREVVYSHLGRDNVQGVANNMKWGLNNRIWVASGSNGGSVMKDGQELLKVGRNDWSFDPHSLNVSRETGGVQFGHSMDDWGNRYLCSNSDHIVHVAIENRYLERNPYYSFQNVLRSISKEGAAAQVFRQSPLEPWRVVRTARRVADPKFDFLPETERVAGGFFTSASGVTIYRGDAYPEEFRGNAFVSDVGSNLVHRKTLTPRGASFLAVRADQGTEFVTSTDTWFRPVNYVNAPDGSLYILDMYRETIEHPFSIPEDIRSQLDLESGNDRGRIYRLKSPAMIRNPTVNLGLLSPTELVEQLASKNAWNRETAQRLIFERQDQTVVPLLVDFLKTTSVPLGRLHALYTLQGLDALDSELLVAAMNDEHAGIREHAIRLSESKLEAYPQLAEEVILRLEDPEYRVRFHALLALGWMLEDQAITGLNSGFSQVKSDPDLRAAYLISVKDQGGDVMSKLLTDKSSTALNDNRMLLQEIAKLVGSRPEQGQVDILLTRLLQPESKIEFGDELLLALQSGLAQRSMSISQFIAQSAASSSLSIAFTAEIEKSARVVSDESRSLIDRLKAIRILQLAPWSEVENKIHGLLAPHQPQELQRAAVEVIGQFRDSAAAQTLIDHWKILTPQLKLKAVEVLLSQSDSTRELLNALSSGQIQKSELDSARYPLLLNHPNSEIKQQAAKIFADLPQSHARQRVEEYLPALELTGDALRGQELFMKNCSVCHFHETTGFKVGPDLSSIQNKNPHDLLIAILDPNREFQLNFSSYTIVTHEGRVFTGMISSETPVSLTLKGPEAKEEVVQRDQIEQLISTGTSLMPEGMEKLLDHQQMADVITYIKSVAPLVAE